MRIRQSHNRLRTFGFTLIELFVVISIIALLISILLPALRSAREAARNASCLSNQRQVGIGTHAYFTDHDDWIPFAWHTTETSWSGYATQNAPAWFVQIAPYLNVPTYDFYRLGGPTFGDWIEKDTVYTCPTHSPQITWPSASPVSYAPPHITAEFAPHSVNGQKRGRLLDVKGQSTKIWIVENAPFGGVNEYSFPVNGLNVGSTRHANISDAFTRHGSSGNALYFDGHAAPMQYQDATEYDGVFVKNPFRVYSD